MTDDMYQGCTGILLFAGAVRKCAGVCCFGGGVCKIGGDL